MTYSVTVIYSPQQVTIPMDVLCSVLQVRKSKVKASAWMPLGEGPLPGSLLPLFCCVLTGWKGHEATSYGSRAGI